MHLNDLMRLQIFLADLYVILSMLVLGDKDLVGLSLGICYLLAVSSVYLFPCFYHSFAIVVDLEFTGRKISFINY